uniref:Geminin n=1 Tax=Plectus sambesii TaxID=2011161 RepID=A0A914XMS6_9BILA
MASALRSIQRTSSGTHLVGVGVQKSSEKEALTRLADKENGMVGKKNLMMKGGQQIRKTTTSYKAKATNTDNVTTQDSSDNTDVSLLVEEESEGGLREMLLSHTPNATYWRLLAERLQRELDAAREENLQLSLELGKKSEECASLQQLAVDGIYYASLVGQAMADGDDSGLFDESGAADQ